MMIMLISFLSLLLWIPAHGLVQSEPVKFGCTLGPKNNCLLYLLYLDAHEPLTCLLHNAQHLWQPMIFHKL